MSVILRRAPKHKGLREALLAALARGDYKPGQKLPSENAIAMTYGVSRTTVREAISSLVHDGLVIRSQGMRMSVAKAPEASTDIAFVLCGRDYTDPHYSAILKGAEQRGASLGYRMLYSHWSEPADMRGIENVLVDHRPVKGIVVAGILDLRHLIGLMDLNPNVVLVGDVLGRDRTPRIVTRIVSNDYDAACTAVKHLLALGHTRIAHITGDLNRCWFRESCDAYVQCLRDNGLEPDPHLIAECSDQGLDDGYQAAERLLKLAVKPTAIFGANDRFAWGAIQALRHARLRVPEDVSVIGTGDLPLGHPRDWLTTMAGSQVEMGAQAVERIASGASGNTEAIVVPMRLAVRRSCAPPAASQTDRDVSVAADLARA